MNPNTSSRGPRYRLHIDESGDHAYNLLDRPDHRYLALLGVWFRHEEDYVPFVDELNVFKRALFGPRPDKPPVVLRRSDIIGRKGPFGILRDDATRKRFDDGLLAVLRQARFTLIVVVIDKKQHLERYKSPMHPYHYCLHAVLDRYSGYLNFKNAVGDVMAEARGGEEDRQLLLAYRQVHQGGTLLFGREHHQRALTTNEMKLRKKQANIAGLQLADLLAHPVKQAMLRRRRLIEWSPSPFAEALLGIARKNANRQEYQGTVDGYGAVWL